MENGYIVVATVTQIRLKLILFWEWRPSPSRDNYKVKENNYNFHQSLKGPSKRSQTFKSLYKDFPGGPGIRLHAPSTGVPGSIPGQGTSFCMHTVTKKSTCCNGDPASHNTAKVDKYLKVYTQ